MINTWTVAPICALTFTLIALVRLAIWSQTILSAFIVRISFGAILSISLMRVGVDLSRRSG